MIDKKVNLSRRSWLIRTISALSTVGMTVWITPFVKFLAPSAKARGLGAPVEVDVSTIEEGSMKVVEWRGIPVYIIRRSRSDIASLQKYEDELKDPNSNTDQQPDYARNRTRSIKPEILIVEGVCTHLGCTPKYRSEKVDGLFTGLFCPCHGSTFDFAGRVYSNVPAPTNLRVPRHRYIDDDKLIIGSDRLVS